MPVVILEVEARGQPGWRAPTKLTEADVVEIRRLRAVGGKLRAIGEHYGDCGFFEVTPPARVAQALTCGFWDICWWPRDIAPSIVTRISAGGRHLVTFAASTEAVEAATPLHALAPRLHAAPRPAFVARDGWSSTGFEVVADQNVSGSACFHTPAGSHAAHRQGSDDSGWVIGMPTQVVEAAFVGWQESTYFGFCQLCTIRRVTR